MKKYFTFLLLIPYISFAQKDSLNSRSEWWSAERDTSMHPVVLPPIDYADLVKAFDKGYKKSVPYTINNDSVYHQVFSRFAKKDLPKIDFTQQELIARFVCSYCLSLGTLNGEPRHRNACSYRVNWSIRKKIR